MKKPNVILNEHAEFLELLYEGELQFRLGKYEYGELVAGIQRWYAFLNVSIGAAALTFAQAAQGTPNPPLNAGIALCWLTLFYFVLKKQYFPKYIHNLRKNKNPIVRDVRRVIEKKLIGGWVVFLKLPFFWIGYLYLFFVIGLSVPELQNVQILDNRLGEIFLPVSCTCYAVK